MEGAAARRCCLPRMQERDGLRSRVGGRSQLPSRADAGGRRLSRSLGGPMREPVQSAASGRIGPRTGEVPSYVQPAVLAGVVRRRALRDDRGGPVSAVGFVRVRAVRDGSDHGRGGRRRGHRHSSVARGKGLCLDDAGPDARDHDRAAGAGRGWRVCRRRRRPPQGPRRPERTRSRRRRGRNSSRTVRSWQADVGGVERPVCAQVCYSRRRRWSNGVGS